ncbi:MAG: multi-sensor signal transduction histidine kinase [Cyanobacteria bacterium RYN_339]|nr:multi-sensor signal transduction histidine kinase [Cyanobacteria bacterium RYN_339]
MQLTTTPTLLANFAAFVRRDHLDELAIENLKRARELDLPLLRLFAHVSDQDLLAQSSASLGLFLDNLAAGKALEVSAQDMARLEADELPGVSRDAVEPADLVLAQAAQRQSLLRFLDRYTSDPVTMVALVHAIDDHYTTAQRASFQVYTRMREHASARVERAEAEREVAKANAEEFQAMTEELQAQSEELQAQAEELQALNLAVTAQVEERTAELLEERENLRVQHDFMQAIVRDIPVGMSFVDRNLVFRWTNAAIAGAYGRQPEEFIGKSMYDLFPSMQRPNPRFEAVLDRGETMVIPGFKSVPFKGAEDLPLTVWDLVYIPVRDKAGNIDGVCTMCIDVTERERQERELKQHAAALMKADRHKDEFLAVLGHELRTPLNFIMGFASVLEDEVPGKLNDRQKNHVGKILAGADRMLRLVEDLLDVARIQAGKVAVERQPTPYALLVRDVVQSIVPLAESKGLTLEWEANSDVVGQLDGPRVVQVLTNLLSNAVKFTPPGGRITVRARREADRVITEIEDTGLGIPAQDLARIFEKFQQLDMSATRDSGGAGLGLAIAKALVEAHDGEIGVRSEEGRGSTFWFALPLEAD